MQNLALSYMPPGPDGLGFLEVEASDGLVSAVLSLRYPAQPEKVLELAGRALMAAVAKIGAELCPALHDRFSIRAAGKPCSSCGAAV